MIETKDIYWLAGLLEGGGCFRSRGKSTLIIQLWMTDRDIVERAHTLMGATTTITVSKRPPRKDAYYFHCSGDLAKYWMETLLPLMGERRREKIKECLSKWKPNTTIRRNLGVPRTSPEYKRLYRAAVAGDSK